MEQFSNSAINKVGDIIRQGKSAANYDEAVATLNIWREQHGPLMDEYYDRCVALAKEIDEKNIIVAQRLKRLPTIIGKLNRFKEMRLSSMQDIAGVRIITSDMEQLGVVESRLLKWGNIKKINDYIATPKSSGYRGKHFIFEQNGMLVEIQLRTQFQHLWATAVETLDVFRGTTLKEKDDNTYWHDFFCQVSSILASTENVPVLSEHKNLDIIEICKLLKKNNSKNGILKKIASFAVVDPIIQRTNNKKAYYSVITLDFKAKYAEVIGFKEEDYHLAFQEYKNRERRNPQNQQTVLIALNQISKIREAYPNYFMNLQAFLKIITLILERNQ